MGSNVNPTVQQVYVINAQQIGSGGSGNVNIVSSIPLDVNVLNPCISICGISISGISLTPQVSIIQSIPLDVNITGVPGSGSTPVSTYAEIIAVPVNSLTAITSFVVPLGFSFYIQGFIAGGTVNAWFKLSINGTNILSGRSTTAKQTIQPSFMGANPMASAGDLVALSVIHQVVGVTPDFEGAILGVLV